MSNPFEITTTPWCNDLSTRVITCLSATCYVVQSIMHYKARRSYEFATLFMCTAATSLLASAVDSYYLRIAFGASLGLTIVWIITYQAAIISAKMPTSTIYSLIFSLISMILFGSSVILIVALGLDIVEPIYLNASLWYSVVQNMSMLLTWIFILLDIRRQPGLTQNLRTQVILAAINSGGCIISQLLFFYRDMCPPGLAIFHVVASMTLFQQTILTIYKYDEIANNESDRPPPMIGIEWRWCCQSIHYPLPPPPPPQRILIL